MIARLLERRGLSRRAALWIEDSIGGLLIGLIIYGLMWLLPIFVELTNGRPL